MGPRSLPMLGALLAAATLAAFALPLRQLAFGADDSLPIKPPTPTDRDRLLEIQALYGKSSYSRVLELAERFEKDFPSSAKLPEVLNLKGLALLLTRNAPAAAAAFEAALIRAPEALMGDRNWKNYVRYNQAAGFLNRCFDSRKVDWRN